MTPPIPADVATALSQISTRWAVLKEPEQFLFRYGPAIYAYLQALLRNSHDVEEISQDILVRVVQEGFARADPERGRFRDYLKTAVRNAALNHLRRKRGVPLDVAAFAAQPGMAAVDAAWLADWHLCIFNKAWRSLESHQRRSPGNLFHTVLQLAVDHPEEDSVALAARATERVGRPIRADAFRKQLSRARRMFARLLVEEVEQTLEKPTRQDIEAELIELGLMLYVRDFLPADWSQESLQQGEED